MDNNVWRGVTGCCSGKTHFQNIYFYNIDQICQNDSMSIIDIQWEKSDTTFGLNYEYDLFQT